MKLTDQEKAECAALLQRLADDPAQIDDDERLKALIAKIHREGKKGQRLGARNEKRAQDRVLTAATGIVSQNSIHNRADKNQLENHAPLSPGALHTAQLCYICKTPFTQLHFFYHQLCPACAAFNYQKRTQRADLRGRVALVTGGRIKIGYQTVLRLLRDGAKVIVTTRFAVDAAQRFAAEEDSDEWRERLKIYSLDLRRIGQVEAFLEHLLQSEESLGILINNAAQTVKRPRAFYEHLLQSQSAALPPVARDFLAGENALALAGQDDLLLETLPHYPDDSAQIQKYFPMDERDADGQQLDLRPHHSWLARLDEIGTLEMLEVQIVNVVAPFLFNSRLKPLLLKSPFARRFIINVSAMEGQFNRTSKTAYHPHTNMAKAALNMMTRTSAQDYARDGIYMNSVDTGWITNENPHPKSERMREGQNFYTPLDIHDGAARVYDPIAQGINDSDEPLCGHFLKDYKPYAW